TPKAVRQTISLSEGLSVSCCCAERARSRLEIAGDSVTTTVNGGKGKVFSDQLGGNGAIACSQSRIRQQISIVIGICRDNNTHQRLCLGQARRSEERRVG